MEDSSYLWIDLFETKLPGGVLGAGEVVENSNLLATFEKRKSNVVVKILGLELRSGGLDQWKMMRSRCASI